MDAGPDILNHNLETVPRLYSRVRPKAVYEQSLELLREAKRIAPRVPTKSGLMAGLGETTDEMLTVFRVSTSDPRCGICRWSAGLLPRSSRN
jgi:lipoic acid synthetase